MRRVTICTRVMVWNADRPTQFAGQGTPGFNQHPTLFPGGAKRVGFVIFLALLFVASVTALGQDTSPRSITINGGRTTVYMGTVQHPRTVRPGTCVGFYDNICGGGYNLSVAYTVSDGSPVNEWSPANQFQPGKTGVTKKITVAMGCVTGNCTAIVIDLMKDCSNTPCGNPDGKPHLCQGTAKVPSSGGLASIKCKAQLTKGSYYWVLVQSKITNAWLGWYWSLSASGGVDLAYNDVWQGYTSGQPTGALTVQ